MVQTETRPLLNPEQQQAHDTLIDYLLSPQPQKHLWWLLKGYAGTGKTFTVSQIIRSIRRMEKEKELLTGIKRSIRIVMSAPTHKAVKVLRRNGTSEVDYATIHSLYGLRPETDEKGVQHFKQDRSRDQLLIESFDVAIIDEVSMLNFELFQYIRTSVEEHGLKVVFMGDPVQIPPVQSKESPAEELNGDSEVLSHPDKYGIGVLELTQVVRQAADNPILSYATELRKVYKDGLAHPIQFQKTDPMETTGLKVISSEDEVQQVLKRFFDTPEFADNPDYMKVISWTNRVVNDMNTRIRKIIYKEKSSEPIIVGEKLVMDAPFELNPSTKEKLKTNDEVIVLEVRTQDMVTEMDVWGTKPDPLGRPVAALVRTTFRVPCYMLTIQYEDQEFAKKTATIPVVHPFKGLKAYNDALETLKMGAKVNCPADPHSRKEAWVKFYKFKEKFAFVKYNYAITAHKSQGSTYLNVLSVEGDINQNRKLQERNRIKYVAATRAKHMLYILK